MLELNLFLIFLISIWFFHTDKSPLWLPYRHVPRFQAARNINTQKEKGGRRKGEGRERGGRREGEGRATSFIMSLSFPCSCAAKARSFFFPAIPAWFVNITILNLIIIKIDEIKTTN